eukprot:760046-Hanusia_phi.AAC.2
MTISADAGLARKTKEERDGFGQSAHSSSGGGDGDVARDTLTPFRGTRERTTAFNYSGLKLQVDLISESPDSKRGYQRGRTTRSASNPTT